LAAGEAPWPADCLAGLAAARLALPNVDAAGPGVVAGRRLKEAAFGRTRLAARLAWEYPGAVAGRAGAVTVGRAATGGRTLGAGA